MKKSLILGYGITGKSFEAYLSKRNINFDILPNAIIEYDWDTRFLYLVTHLMINYKFGDDSKKIFNSPILYSYGSLISNTLSITKSFGIDDYEAIKIIPNFYSI